ncbi:MAG: hypothetical protein J5548_06385 [Prevotella sp.]|nr:hypothetical protein [Prevotella sp.]
MMRRNAFITLLFALAVTMTLFGCHGDSGDGVMERPDYTSIDFKLALSPELLKFYNVQATYTSISEEDKTVEITNETWRVTEKVEGYRNIDFKLKVLATVKSQEPRLDEKVDEYALTCEYSAEYYTKPTSAKRMAQVTLDKKLKKTGVTTFLAENPVITLVNYQKNNNP